MERRPIHFTVHVRNVTAKLKANPLPPRQNKCRWSNPPRSLLPTCQNKCRWFPASSPKQMSLVPKSSSPEKMQLLFTPLMLASEPSGTLTSSMLPVEILRKIGRFASVEAMRNLIATCKYIRNQLNTWFLQLLASQNNPDRATSGFIIDAIGNKGNTCLWCNAKFFIKDHDIPKDLSIHLFANTTAKKISSDEVRSMIIQLSGITGVISKINSRIPKISFLLKCHSRI